MDIIIISSMSKVDYISFIADCTIDRIQMKKLYSEQNAEVLFVIDGLKLFTITIIKMVFS